MLTASARRLPRHARRGFTLLEVLVVVAILVILASVATFATVSYLRGARIDEATMKAANIQKAAMAFYTKSGGTYPPSLEVLAMSTPEYGPPLLEGGAGAITDPWGQPYQFDVIVDNAGQERFVVFTTSPDGQQITWPRQ